MQCNEDEDEDEDKIVDHPPSQGPWSTNPRVVMRTMPGGEWSRWLGDQKCIKNALVYDSMTERVEDWKIGRLEDWKTGLHELESWYLA